jgi:hypothetical protein
MHTRIKAKGGRLPLMVDSLLRTHRISGRSDDNVNQIRRRKEYLQYGTTKSIHR